MTKEVNFAIYKKYRKISVFWHVNVRGSDGIQAIEEQHQSIRQFDLIWTMCREEKTHKENSIATKKRKKLSDHGVCKAMNKNDSRKTSENS